MIEIDIDSYVKEKRKQYHLGAEALVNRFAVEILPSEDIIVVMIFLFFGQN